MQAMAVMEERNIRHLPVFDGDQLLGMMSIKVRIASGFSASRALVLTATSCTA
jgi:signal-transduction protein with cAMP-binding, CBS, and nucleotidyltransferase domain